MNFLENELSIFFETTDHLVFFGKTTATLEKIIIKYPHYCFLRIRQTHSDICVTASDFVVEADSHLTSQKNTALLISTADCIPIMVYCRQTNRVAAIHAGWRGAANQITVKTLFELMQTGSTAKDFIFYFGPHILQSSFEISEDVFIMLSASQVGLEEGTYTKKEKNKFYVNLEKIVISQIISVVGNQPVIYSAGIDTKTDLDFNSYRRGKQNHERNLSFIVIKSPS
jgi:YfiH family protein